MEKQSLTQGQATRKCGGGLRRTRHGEDFNADVNDLDSYKMGLWVAGVGPGTGSAPATPSVAWPKLFLPFDEALALARSPGWPAGSSGGSGARKACGLPRGAGVLVLVAAL